MNTFAAEGARFCASAGRFAPRHNTSMSQRHARDEKCRKGFITDRKSLFARAHALDSARVRENWFLVSPGMVPHYQAAGAASTDTFYATAPRNLNVAGPARLARGSLSLVRRVQRPLASRSRT